MALYGLKGNETEKLCTFLILQKKCLQLFFSKAFVLLQTFLMFFALLNRSMKTDSNIDLLVNYQHLLLFDKCLKTTVGNKISAFRTNKHRTR